MREGVTRLSAQDVLLGKGDPARAGPPRRTTTPPVPGDARPGQGRPAIAENPAPAKPAGKTYTMQRGDVLSVVAQKTLGSARRWHELVETNKGRHRRPDNIPAGTVRRSFAGPPSADPVRFLRPSAQRSTVFAKLCVLIPVSASSASVC